MRGGEPSQASHAVIDDRGTSLRPMANLFAVSDRDRGFLDELAHQLREVGEFTDVHRPHEAWTVALASLPYSSSEAPSVRARNYFFVEGRDRLETTGDEKWLDTLDAIVLRRPHALAELPGDFTFLRVLPDGRLMAVRSCAGLAPLYVTAARGRVAVGTRLGFFPRFLPGRYRPDGLVNAAWGVTTHFIEHRTFIDGVKVVPRGSYTYLNAGGPPRSSVYWDPSAGAVPMRKPIEHAERLREILIATLRRDLDPAGRNMVALSGGVDSGSVAALAVRTLGIPLMPFSLLPPIEPFRSRERSYIEPLVRELGIGPTHAFTLDNQLRLEYLEPFAALPFPAYHPVLGAMRDLPRFGKMRVLVGAEFADDVCGEAVRLGDWAQSTALIELLGAPLRTPFGLGDVRFWANHRWAALRGQPHLPLPATLPRWAAPAVQEEYETWRSGLAARKRRNPSIVGELQDRVLADAWAVMHWEGCTPYGVRRSMPFFSREVLELAFGCHPHDLLAAQKKGLLRRALQGDAPARSLFRADKGGGWGHIAAAPIQVTLDQPPLARPLIAEAWHNSESPQPIADALSLISLIRVCEWLQGESGQTTPA